MPYEPIFFKKCLYKAWFQIQRLQSIFLLLQSVWSRRQICRLHGKRCKIWRMLQSWSSNWRYILKLPWYRFICPCFKLHQSALNILSCPQRKFYPIYGHFVVTCPLKKGVLLFLFVAHFEKMLVDKKISDDLKKEVTSLMPKVK